MIRSLSVKLAMLAITMGIVLWNAWHPTNSQPNPSESIDHQLLNKSPSVAEVQSRETPVIQSAGGPIAVSPGVPNHVGVADHAVPRLVDLNSATVDELESLPGIGAVLAKRVIAYRQSVGRFLAVEDLREVKGIGSKTFDRIKPWVTVASGEQKSKTEKRPS